MINQPSVDSLVEKLGSKEHPASRYALRGAVAKRAGQIRDSEQNQGIKELPGNVKEIALACQEIENGTLHMTRD